MLNLKKQAGTYIYTKAYEFLSAEIDKIAQSGKYAIPQEPTYELANPDKYYKRKKNDGGEPIFIEIENAKSIKIPDNEDLDFFITQDENTKKWIVYDGKTGLFITEGKTQKEAVENAEWEVKRHPNIKAIIEAHLPNFSPRYKVEIPTTPITQTTKTEVAQNKKEAKEKKIESAGTTETLSNTTNREFIQNVKIAWQKSKPEKSSQPDPLDNLIVTGKQIGRAHV